MATRLYIHNAFADVHIGTNASRLDGSTGVWRPNILDTIRGSGAVAETTNTVTGATNGVEVVDGAAGIPYEWWSWPLDADTTISGAITGNLWAAENNMSANVAINFVVDKVSATTNTITQIVKSARTTEVAVTTRAVNNFTATPGAGVTLDKGDRLRVRIFGDDAGTMASGFTFSFGFSGSSAGVDGDSYIEFTETFGFLSGDPSTTQLFLTDTASDCSTASVDKEAWTSRGGGVTNKATNTSAGWVSPIQMTDGAGGTVIDWFTKQLQAFTLSGLIVGNIRMLESNAAANASVRLEIARVNSDGTSPTVYSSWGCAPNQNGHPDVGELGTTERVEFFRLSGDDLAFTDGQRIRIRLYVDDAPYNGPLVTGHTASVYYAGTSGGASGDSWIKLGQTLTEFSSTPTSIDLEALARRTPRRRILQRM